MVAQEIRQAIRSVWRAPLFAGVVVLLLALGIGSNALIFTAVETLLLRPLPVHHPEQIGMVLHVSVRGNPASTIAALTGMLRGVGPGLAPTDVATLEQEINTSLWQERLLAALSSLLALVSTVLAGLGLFGMLAYSVSRRTHEIGIRVAVGASAGRIARMIGRDAASAVVPGLVLGLAAYGACSRAVAAPLYGVTPWDVRSVSARRLV
jgi:hypothetical protein